MVSLGKCCIHGGFSASKCQFTLDAGRLHLKVGRASQGRNWWLGLHILATVFCQKNGPPIIEKQVLVSTPLKNN